MLGAWVRTEGSGAGTQEGTGDVRAGASIGHGQQAGRRVLQIKILVSEFLAIDRLAAGAVEISKVAALKHKILDNAVEQRALVVQRLARFANALFARAESAKVC